MATLKQWFVKKKSGISKNRRRWCELWDGEIRYFETQSNGDGVSQKGEIRIAKGETTVKGAGCVLTVKVGGKSFVLETVSEAVVKTWVDAINGQLEGKPSSESPIETTPRASIVNPSYQPAESTTVVPADPIAQPGIDDGGAKARGQYMEVTDTQSAVVVAEVSRDDSVPSAQYIEVSDTPVAAALTSEENPTPTSIETSPNLAASARASPSPASANKNQQTPTAVAPRRRTLPRTPTANSQSPTAMAPAKSRTPSVANNASAPIANMGSNTRGTMPPDSAAIAPMVVTPTVVSEHKPAAPATVIAPAHEVSLEGWFIKRGAGKIAGFKRRYLRLEGSAIGYYATYENSEPTNLKGHIYLDSRCSVSADGEKLRIRTADRSWVLLADNGVAQASLWAKRLFDLCRSMSSSGTAPISARSRAPTLDLGDLGQESVADEPRSGTPALTAWFAKKAAGRLGKTQRRFFVQKDTELQYFASEGQDRVGQDQKGSIELLEETTISRNFDTLTIHNPDRDWVLTAENEAVAVEWHDTLQKLETSVEKADLNPRPHAWFVKTNPAGKNQTRFCELAGSVVYYYSQASDVQFGIDLKGSIALTATSAVNVQDGGTLCIVNPDRVWYLRSEEDDTANAWAALISAAIDDLTIEAAANEKPEMSSSEFRSRSDTLDPAPMLSHLKTLVATMDEPPALTYGAVKEELIAKFGTRIVKAYRQAIIAELPEASDQPVGGNLESASTPGEEDGLLTAWFVKKAQGVGKDKRRYCELHDEGIRYFENVQQEVGVSQKGTIKLDRTSVVSTEGPTLLIQNKDRTWELQARNSDEATMWREAIHQAIVEATYLGSTSGAINMFPGRGVWLTKHKKATLSHSRRRYFIPEYEPSSDALRFSYYASVTPAGQPSDQKGAILLSEDTTIECDGVNLVLANGAEAPWLLSAENASVASQWLHILQGLQKERRNRSGTRVRPLLVRLQELLMTNDVLPLDAAEEMLIAEYGQAIYELFEDEVKAAVSRKEEEISASRCDGGVWLLKKPEKGGRSKKRWFEIHDRNFCYFARIENSRGADQKGSCPITQASIITSKSDHVVISNPDRVWDLVACTDEIAREWTNRLIDMQHRDRQNFDAALADLTTVQRLPFTDVRQKLIAEFGTDTFEHRKNSVVQRLPNVPTPTSGLWMVKKGAGKLASSHRRWFELVGTELRYFEGVKDGLAVDQKGSIEIMPQTKITVDGKQIRLENEDRVWDLTAESEADAATLLGLLERSRNAEAISLQESLDHIIETASAAGKSYAAIKNEVIASHGESAFESRKATIARRTAEKITTGEQIELDSGSVANSDGENVPQLNPSGWLVKKAPGKLGKRQRRWFVLVRNELQYFVSEEGGEGVEQRGAVSITPLTKLGVNGKTLLIVNHDRTWDLEASDTSEAAQWEGWLLGAQNQMKSDFYSRVHELKEARGSELRFTELEIVLRAEFGEEMLANERTKLLKTITFAAAPLSDTIVTDGADDTLHHAAWFLKKAGTKLGKDRKRYFVLKGTELLYFEDAVNGRGVNQKGSIEILPTTSVTSENHTIRIDTGERVWLLLADDPPQAKYWKDLLIQAQAGTEGPFVARLNSEIASAVQNGQIPTFSAVKDALVAHFGLQLFERHRKLVIDAIRKESQQHGGQGLEGAANVSKQSGWLMKKGKKRWFELVGSDMHYYVEVDDEGIGQQFRGAITISSDTVVTTKGRLLTIRNPDRVWNLTAPSDEAASQWEYILGELHPLLAANVVDWLHNYLKHVTINTFDFCALKMALIEEFRESTYRQNQSAVARAIIEMKLLNKDEIRTGWFYKKAGGQYGKDKRRYFQQSTNSIKYFVDADDAKKDSPKGEIRLTPSTDIWIEGREVHVLTASREWVYWTADGSKTASTQWECYLLVAREQLTIDMTCFFKAFAKHMKTSRHHGASVFGLLKDSCIEEFGHDEFYGFEPLALEMAKDLEIALLDNEDGEDDIDFSGWLLKQPKSRGKARRRYFELFGTELRYFEDLYRGRGIVEKGSIELRGDFSVERDNLTFVLRGADREWELTADTASEASQWVTELEEAIDAAAEEAQSVDTGEDEIDLFPGQGAWFRKRKAGAGNRIKSKNRYFTLVMGLASKNLRFNYYAEYSDGVAREKRGYVAISTKSAISCEGKLLVVGNSDAKWRLTADEADVAALWRRLLTQAVAERGASESGMPLTARLEMLLKENPDEPPTLEVINETLKAEFGLELWVRSKSLIEDRVNNAHIEKRRPKVAGAWFTKKADSSIAKSRRRWFELHGNEVRYFVSENGGRGVDQKGVISIFHYTNIMFSSKELVVTNPTRAFELVGESMDEVAAWGLALKKLVKLLNPEFNVSQFDAAAVQGGPAAEDSEGLADWFSIQDEGSTNLQKRYLVLQNLEIAIYRQADVTGCGTGLVETVVIGKKTAISVGNVTVKLQVETAKWELHAAARRTSPTKSAQEVAQEWSARLREKRNDLIKAEREKKKAAEAARIAREAEAAAAAPPQPVIKPIQPRRDAEEAKRREKLVAEEKLRLSVEEDVNTRHKLAHDELRDNGNESKKRKRRKFANQDGCCVIS